MRVPIHIAVAVSIALTSAGYAQASKRIHKSHRAASAIQSTPGYEHYWGNAAADGNNANSMRGSNSAVENPNGRTNCC
jgi:hypothetical protein